MKTQLILLCAVLVCPAFARGLDESALDSVRDQGRQQIESTTYVQALQKKLGQDGFSLEDRRTFVMESAPHPSGRQVKVVQMQQFIKPVLTPVTHARPQRKVVYWSTLVVLGFDDKAREAEEKHVRPVRFQDKTVNLNWKTEQQIQEVLASPKITEGLKAVVIARMLIEEPEVKAILEHPYDGQGKSAPELAQWILKADKAEYLRDIVTGYFAL